MTLLAVFGIGKNNAEPPAQQIDNTASYTVSQKTVQFTFVSNPSTGYDWSYTQQGESVRMTKEAYKGSNQTNVAGAPGKQYYTFTAATEGKTTVRFIYERPWENNAPVYTYVAVISVDADLNITVDSFSAL